MRRWPALVIIACLLIGGVVVGSTGADDATDGGDDVALTALIPVAAPPDALDSVWFCAGQSAGDDTAADGTLVIANVGDDDATGEISVVPAGDAVEPTVEAVEVPALTTRRVRVADIVEADWAAATISLDGGTVVVEHEVVGPEGRDVAPCQNRAGDAWSFAAGASTRDATMALAVYNPFPGQATVDVAFTTEEGVREPSAFQGVPVAPHSLTVLDVSAVVTERAVIGTSLTTRRGQVVVDRIQTFDGEGAATTAEEADAEGYVAPRGITLTPGVRAPGLYWRLPAGVSSDFVREQVVVANPTDDVAEVELTFALEEPDRNGTLEPFPLTVGPGESTVFDVASVGTVPNVPHSIEVRSENRVPVVVERLLSAVGDSPYVGRAASTGTPVAAPQWVFAAGPSPSVESGRIALVNPGDAAVEVALTGFGAGTSIPIPATPPGEGAETGPQRFTLAAGARFEVALTGASSIEVSATGPIVAERRLVAVPADPDEADDDETGLGTSTAMGIPLPDGLVALD